MRAWVRKIHAAFHEIKVVSQTIHLLDNSMLTRKENAVSLLASINIQTYTILIFFSTIVPRIS